MYASMANSSRVLCKMTASGRNVITLSNEKKLNGRRIYLEYISVIGSNFPTSEMIVIQPVNCKFSFPETDASTSAGITLAQTMGGYYFPLTAAATFERFEPPIVLDASNIIPQNLTFNVFNQSGGSTALTFTALYLQFLIQ